MSLSCVITVKGGSGNGQPKNDLTKPVSEFLVDNVYYYNKVLQHLRSCDKCDPVEALKVYLQRRREIPKFNGLTSFGLVRLSKSYEKLFIKRDLLSKDSSLKDLILEFSWRSGIPSILINNYGEFTWSQRVEAIRLQFKDNKITDARYGGNNKSTYNKKEYDRKCKTYSLIWSIFENSSDIVFSSERELQDLLDVAEVIRT